MSSNFLHALGLRFRYTSRYVCKISKSSCQPIQNCFLHMPTVKNCLTKRSNLVTNLLSCPYQPKDPTKHNNLTQNGKSGATKHDNKGLQRRIPEIYWNLRFYRFDLLKLDLELLDVSESTEKKIFGTFYVPDFHQSKSDSGGFQHMATWVSDSPGYTHIDRVAMPGILDFLELYVEMITWQVPIGPFLGCCRYLFLSSRTVL